MTENWSACRAILQALLSSEGSTLSYLNRNISINCGSFLLLLFSQITVSCGDLFRLSVKQLTNLSHTENSHANVVLKASEVTTWSSRQGIHMRILTPSAVNIIHIGNATFKHFGPPSSMLATSKWDLVRLTSM